MKKNKGSNYMLPVKDTFLLEEQTQAENEWLGKDTCKKSWLFERTKLTNLKLE